jgi:CheY-like chemotaxis protein
MKTILIVDDQDVQRKTLKRAFRTHGYLVSEANSGKEALEHIEEEKVDAVLTDYAMPEMNGIELLQNIRETNSDIPVVIMTAYGDEELVIKAMQYRCDGFIHKPFGVDELLECLSAFL